MTKVENLKKVTLRLEAGTTINDMNLSLPCSEFEFIFGIGSSGMCPFEYQLANKATGEEISRRFTTMLLGVRCIFEIASNLRRVHYLFKKP